MSFWELSVVIIVGLLVIGPARLPEAIKTGYTWLTRIKRAINDAKTEFEHQIGADDIRRELHNEKILKSLGELKALKSDLEKSANKIHPDNHPELTDDGFNAYLENEAHNQLSHDDHHHDHDYHMEEDASHHHDDSHDNASSKTTGAATNTEKNNASKPLENGNKTLSERSKTAPATNGQTTNPEPQTKTS